MARIRPLTKDEASAELHPAFETGQSWLGQPVISTGIQAHAPAILEASRALGAAPAKSGLLGAELRSLVCLRVAEMVGCPF